MCYFYGGSGAPNITRARDNATRGNKRETMESGLDKNLRAGMCSELMQDFYSHAVLKQFPLSGDGVNTEIGQWETGAISA